MVVVAGHSIMAVVAWPDGVPVLGNLLAAYPWTQALTWVLQIMPLFFVAGGAANALSWERHKARGGDYATWLWARADRLLRPAWVYLAIMAVVATLVTVLAPARTAEPLMVLVTQLLWFLGAYLLVTALTPLFRRTTPGRAVLVTAGLLGLVAVVDVARFYLGLPDAIGLLNFVLVWAVPAYLGSLRAHGTAARLPGVVARPRRPRRVRRERGAHLLRPVAGLDGRHAGRGREQHGAADRRPGDPLVRALLHPHPRERAARARRSSARRCGVP